MEHQNEETDVKYYGRFPSKTFGSMDLNQHDLSTYGEQLYYATGLNAWDFEHRKRSSVVDELFDRAEAHVRRRCQEDSAHMLYVEFKNYRDAAYDSLEPDAYTCATVEDVLIDFAQALICVCRIPE